MITIVSVFLNAKCWRFRVLDLDYTFIVYVVLDSQKYMKFMGKIDLSLRLEFRIVDAQERTLLVAN